MSYRLIALPPVEKDLRGLPTAECAIVRERIRQLRDDPWPAGTVKLRGGHRNLYRLRVGDFRVIYDVEEQRQVIRIVAVGNRSNVYDRLARRGLD